MQARLRTFNKKIMACTFIALALLATAWYIGQTGVSLLLPPFLAICAIGPMYLLHGATRRSGWESLETSVVSIRGRAITLREVILVVGVVVLAAGGMALRQVFLTETMADDLHSVVALAPAGLLIVLGHLLLPFDGKSLLWYTAGIPLSVQVIIWGVASNDGVAVMWGVGGATLCVFWLLTDLCKRPAAGPFAFGAVGAGVSWVITGR